MTNSAIFQELAYLVNYCCLCFYKPAQILSQFHPGEHLAFLEVLQTTTMVGVVICNSS